MNWLGHALLAHVRRAETAFVLGAMLPDLAALARLRVAHVGEPVLQAGVAFHHAGDAVFHAAPGFAALCLEGAAALREAGVRRGPARAAAHVGVELLLDAWLAAEHGVAASVPRALAAGQRELTVTWRGEAGAPAFQAVCRRAAAALAAGPAAGPGLVTRVERTLARRPRLALAPGERGPLAAWLSGLEPGFAPQGRQLWSQLEAGVAARDAGT